MISYILNRMDELEIRQKLEEEIINTYFQNIKFIKLNDLNNGINHNFCNYILI